MSGSVLSDFSLFTSEMAGLQVPWLSTTPPYFATRLYWSAVTLNSGCPSWRTRRALAKVEPGAWVSKVRYLR